MTACNYVIDLSGRPFDNMYIGIVKFESNFIKRFLKSFSNRFPHLVGYKKKASKLPDGRLESIIRFMNDEQTRMMVVPFTKKDWEYHYEVVQKFRGIKSAYFREKILGILYFTGLVQHSKKNTPYQVTICNEGQLKDINTVMDVITKLGKRDGYLFRVNFGYAKSDPLLKFADYVAGCCRKIDRKNLNSLRFLKVLDCATLDPTILKRVFR